ncbi:alpha/beta hydrolase [Kineococcus sp. SYSU DK005]|uniref:alpha/beta hydrolase n=1 Tax=Kineococcus sp. SYSU DK005 TaxID=3383126 RepID=UPI003D7EA5A2
MSSQDPRSTPTAADLDFAAAANASGRTPVLFVHGLWLHAASWQPWVRLFESVGYAAHAPGWPGDGATVAQTRAHPERLAGVGIEAVSEHLRRLIGALEDAPVLVGHSFGGLVVQKLLGEGLARAAVAVDPAQMRGVLHLPLVQLRNALPVLANPARFSGTDEQSPERFARAFANAVPRAESDDLHARWSIPAPGRPLFEAALANVLVSTPAAVRTGAERGPLLIVGGGRDRTVPALTTRAIARRYRDGSSTTEYHEFADRGHSLVVDSGWREVAEHALRWLTSVGHPAAVGPAPRRAG